MKSLKKDKKYYHGMACQLKHNLTLQIAQADLLRAELIYLEARLEYEFKEKLRLQQGVLDIE